MGTLKLIFGLVLIVGVVWAIFQIAPPIMSNYGFQDDLRTVALVDGSSFQKTDEDIRTDVLKKAREHDLPIEARQISVQRLSTPGLSSIYVSADYNVTVNLPGYSFDMHFTPNSGNKAF